MESKKEFHDKLMFACEHGDIDQIKSLLDGRKHELDGKCLPFACYYGNKEVVELLINHDANLNKMNKNGKNVLTFAFEMGRRQLFDLLIAKEANFNCKHGFKLLMENCKKKETDDFEFLLKNGAPIDEVDENGMSPLMVASEQGFIEKVRILLNHSSVKINRINKDGSSSLHLACMNNHQEVVRVLVEHGADLLLKYQNKLTCLSLTYKHQDASELVKYLIGKEPHLMNRDSEFFVEVFNRNDWQMFKYLVETYHRQKDSALILAINQ